MFEGELAMLKEAQKVLDENSIPFNKRIMIIDNAEDAKALIKAIEASKQWSNMLTCDKCGKKKSDVRNIEDPYMLEIHDTVIEITVCNECYNLICEEI